ncbi:NTP transferase domain-containing protein [Candidatus Woesearchaeota archaeon]|jgi:bifunctional UDP-N-acetylglucosamine pyrophosphorylase / glucosamine-1-phosphate N-acetyltransferase|nr:NTP transferase domain-containing protein [Candidatus Woesearchaeota archaeon]MBT5740571.1 NTP transferase domain-containing protein [Candidatus Woesearchaeota archaeon]
MQALILAAGKGTRFSDEKSKVLHEVNGISLVKHVINLVDSVGIQKKVVVIGHQGEAVQKHLQDSPNILFAWQHEQKGTGHAVMMAETFLSFDQDVLILYGDVPALKEETIRKLLNEHQTSKNQVTILSANLDNPKWYGRIVREDGEIVAIREMRDASDEELKIKEVNSGIYVVNGEFLLNALSKITSNNQQGEYYLTDIVEIACIEGKRVGSHTIDHGDEIKGVNSMEELIEIRILVEKQNI